MEKEQRVILFYPSHKYGMSVQPRIEIPLGLLAVGSPLDRAGYKVVIIDQRIEDQWRQKLSAEISQGAVCVGISSMTGPQINNGLEAARLVKETSRIPVVWGGIHPTLLPRQTLNDPYVDIVVQGEGEETFPELVKALAEKSPLDQVKGIWFKEKDSVISTSPRPPLDLNRQPPLSYHLVDLKKYLVKLHGRDHISLETSRGCQYKCTYCYNTTVFNSRWRGLATDEVLKRVKLLAQNPDIQGILFSDDNFFGDKKRALQIFQHIKKENLAITFSKLDAHMSVLSSLTDSELTLLRDCGCRMFMIGIESGSSRILQILKKEIKISELLSFNHRINKFDIMPLYFFMMGYPTETYQELAQTIKLYLQITKENKDAVTHVNVYTPFPGTELYDLCIQNGLKVPEKLPDWTSFNYRTVNHYVPWLSKKRKKMIRMLHFCTLMTEERIFLKPYKKTPPRIVFMAKIYHPLAKWRVEKLNCRFLFEIKLAEWLGLYPKQG